MVGEVVTSDIDNKKQLKVSCIVIFYNVSGDFLREALDSILAQTYSNYEILMVDDGSTFLDCRIVASEYVDRYPEICRLLQHADATNRGMSASRNLGLLNATGDFVFCLDADDVINENTFLDQVSLFAKNPRDICMVFGPILHWFSWIDKKYKNSSDWVEDNEILYSDKVLTRIYKAGELALPLIKNKVSISGMMYRRETALEFNGYEERFRGLYEDQVFCLKMCLSHKIMCSNTQWYKYRQHPNSECSKAIRNSPLNPWIVNRGMFLRWVLLYFYRNKMVLSTLFLETLWEVVMYYKKKLKTIIYSSFIRIFR